MTFRTTILCDCYSKRHLFIRTIVSRDIQKRHFAYERLAVDLSNPRIAEQIL